MSGERFINARVHEWLTPTIDAVTHATHTTRLQLNSAALWWFLTRLSTKQRAEILGEYVKLLALGTEETEAKPPPRPSRGTGKSSRGSRS